MNHDPRARACSAIACAAVALVLAAGCAGSGAHSSATTLPGAHLAGMQRFYVQHQSQDKRHIEVEIQRILTGLGFHADVGEAPPPVGEYDAWVTYIDRYMWDMTMYCLQLTIYVRDTRTGYVVSTGSSYRPSLVRKTPAGHAKLILTELFRGGGAQ